MKCRVVACDDRGVPQAAALQMAGRHGWDLGLAGVGCAAFHRRNMRTIDDARRTRPRLWVRSWGGSLVLLVLAGCQTSDKPLDFDPLVPRFLMEAPAQAPSTTTVELPISKVRVPVYPRAVLNEVDIANVELVRVDLGLCLMFDCTPTGARNLMRLSAANLGRRLVVTLNGTPFGARLLEGAIHDGRLFIFVEMNDEQITSAAVDLKKTVHEVQAARARGQGKDNQQS
jgi:hypothetical protein